MKFRILVLFSFLVIVLSSCLLNAEQEAALQQHLNNYLKAKNNCMLVGIVGFTYPEYIRELKEEGDSIFLQTIDCTKLPNHTRLTNPTIRSSKKEGNQIHIYYQLDVKNLKDDSVKKQIDGLIAISEDNGDSWYFLPKIIYSDKSKCTRLKRLIEIKN